MARHSGCVLTAEQRAARLAQIVAMYEAGYTVRAIADYITAQTGRITYQRVYQLLRGAGITPRNLREAKRMTQMLHPRRRFLVAMPAAQLAWFEALTPVERGAAILCACEVTFVNGLTSASGIE